MDDLSYYDRSTPNTSSNGRLMLIVTLLTGTCVGAGYLSHLYTQSTSKRMVVKTLLPAQPTVTKGIVQRDMLPPESPLILVPALQDVPSPTDTAPPPARKAQADAEFNYSVLGPEETAPMAALAPAAPRPAKPVIKQSKICLASRDALQTLKKKMKGKSGTAEQKKQLASQRKLEKKIQKSCR